MAHTYRPIVDLRLFRDCNLAAASGIMLVFGLALFGTIAIQPMMLERLLGYPAETTGLVMAPLLILLRDNPDGEGGV